MFNLRGFFASNRTNGRNGLFVCVFPLFWNGRPSQRSAKRNSCDVRRYCVLKISLRFGCKSTPWLFIGSHLHFQQQQQNIRKQKFIVYFREICSCVTRFRQCFASKMEFKKNCCLCEPIVVYWCSHCYHLAFHNKKCKMYANIFHN